jgi:hypothetical protein
METVQLEDIWKKSDYNANLRKYLLVACSFGIALCSGKLLLEYGTPGDPSVVPISLFFVLSLNAYFYAEQLYRNSPRGTALELNNQKITELTIQLNSRLFEVEKAKWCGECLQIYFRFLDQKFLHVVTNSNIFPSDEKVPNYVTFPESKYILSKDKIHAILEFGNIAYFK